MVVLIVILAWVVSGIIGSVLLWTREDDLTFDDLGVVLICSIFGPIVWVTLLVDSVKGKTIIKRRKQ